MDAIDDSPLMFVTQRPQVMFVRGEGSWLYDGAGRSPARSRWAKCAVRGCWSRSTSRVRSAAKW